MADLDTTDNALSARHNHRTQQVRRDTGFEEATANRIEHNVLAANVVHLIDDHCEAAWMAGGGVKAGTTYGATDDFGYSSVTNRVAVHDLNATALSLLGIDHLKMTYFFQGRNFRLTDTEGQIVRGLVA